MKWFTSDRTFYRSFWVLTVTLMLEQAVILSVNLADNIMLGRFEEHALAGVAAVNQIQFVLQQVVYAVSNGMIILGSQYWGQGRVSEVRQFAAIAMRVALLITIALFIAVSIAPVQALRLFTPDALIIAVSFDYSFQLCFFRNYRDSAGYASNCRIRAHRAGRVAHIAAHQLLDQLRADIWALWFSDHGRTRCGDRHADCSRNRMRYCGCFRASARGTHSLENQRFLSVQRRAAAGFCARCYTRNSNPIAMGRIQCPANSHIGAYERCCHRGAIHLIQYFSAA